MSEKEKSSKNNENKKIHDEALARFELVEDAESEIRKLSLEDINFSVGEQWPDQIKIERERDGRPCLVINKIPQFIQQITNDQRQNRPSIKVHPVDDNADVETAKIIQGIIRHIENNSNAEVAYDTAFESAARGGFGYFRIVTDYVDQNSFEQEILIKRIRNPFSVFFDPNSQEPDGSDANFAFVVENLTKEEFKEKYPKSKLASSAEWESLGTSLPSWMPDGSARVAEYFYKDFKYEDLVLLNTGETLLKSQLPKELPEGIEIVKERSAKIQTINWVKLNGCEILEKTVWPGSYIPIIPVYGNEIEINGKRILEGIVRNAKDPARMYNYWVSAETEAIALAPRAPYVAAEGQLEGYEQEWESANRRNHSVLTYKAKDINGQVIGAPQRQAFEPAVQAITQARMLASDDIKATTGIYDAALGSRSNETSGIAINSRKVQAQTSNFHFIDNLSRSLRHAGRILVDLIPKIYDTARTARVIGEDGEQKIVKLNQAFDENGKEIIYDLSVGKYDVTIDVGPSFQSKRQEAVQSMIEVTRAVPQLMQVAGDLLVKNMDWPGAQELAERIKKTLPPNILDDQSKQKQVDPQVQAQMQQMNQMIDQLTKQLNEAHDVIDNKMVEIQSRERIEMAKLETTATIELAKLESKEALQMLTHQIAEIDARTKMLGINEPFNAHEINESLNPNEMNGENDAASGVGYEPTGGQSLGQSLEGSIHEHE